jgi:GTP-binding protein EngB required for normal cell division
MRRNYKLNQQLITFTLFISLFLQNCSGFFNTPIDAIEEQNKQPDIQVILDKEFVAEGGHLVSFYQGEKDIKANVKINPLDEKDKFYDEVNVIIEKGIKLDDLVKLDKKTQQKRIQIHFSDEHKGKPKSVVIHKPWLLGGSPDEIIVFLGNPGAGKSTLCNSIFQQVIFNSGLSFGTGMTTEKQEYIYENKLYIDTPGLDDVEKRLKAAIEIEEALKKNNNYKIVFVATLEDARIKPADLQTINTVCDALKDVDFQYGLIFNKIDELTMELIKESGITIESLRKFLQPLHKQPSSIIHLLKDNRIAGRRNMYFNSSDNNREELLKFLNDLPANMIKESEVKSLDVRRFEEKIEEMERSCQQAWREVSELRKTVEIQREEIAELKKDSGGCVLY